MSFPRSSQGSGTTATRRYGPPSARSILTRVVSPLAALSSRVGEEEAPGQVDPLGGAEGALLADQLDRLSRLKALGLVEHGRFDDAGEGDFAFHLEEDAGGVHRLDGLHLIDLAGQG